MLLRRINFIPKLRTFKYSLSRQFSTAKDPYKILDLPRNSSIAEIKQQYYKLSQKYHPDKGGDSQMFILVKEAYETLSNPLNKRELDHQDLQQNRKYRQEMNTRLDPNDYYQFKSNYRPGFNSRVHFDKHYGSKLHEDSLYYKELYERKQLKPYKLFLLSGFGLMLYYSDMIQLLFLK